MCIYICVYIYVYIGKYMYKYVSFFLPASAAVLPMQIQLCAEGHCYSSVRPRRLQRHMDYDEANFLLPSLVKQDNISCSFMVFNYLESSIPSFFL